MIRELVCPRCETPFPYEESLRGREMACRQCSLVFAVSPWDPAQSPRKSGPAPQAPTADKPTSGGRLSPRGLAWIVAGVGLLLVLMIGVPVVGFILLPGIAASANQGTALADTLLPPDGLDQPPPDFAAAPGVLRAGAPGGNVAPQPADGITVALDDLDAGDAAQQKRGAESLAHMKPEPERRTEVLRALKEVLSNGDRFAPRDACVRALAVWATRREVPYLLGLLDHPDGGVRREAIVGLGKLKDGRAAPLLARRLSIASERACASEALKQIGSDAEMPVREQLRHPDAAVRREVCHILQTIGTADSYPALKKAVEDPDDGVVRAAREALPPGERPPVYRPAETMTLAIHVRNPDDWAGLEARVRRLLPSSTATVRVTTSGDWKWVKLAPVRSDAAQFSRRITFGKITAVHKDQRLIYVEPLGR